MILRKPYKFLIKNFRIIHLVLLLLSSYLVYRTNNILSFFNEYLESSSLISVFNLTNNLFGGLIFLVPILILAIIISIIYLLYWKKKPIKFYIFNLVIYILTIIFYIYIFSVCKRLETSIIDIRILRLTDNILLMLLVGQVLSTIFFLIRTLGFDLKKFNFKDDKEFEISDTDNEEFEFNVNFDSNNLKRSFNQKRRNLIYSYHENKFVSNIIIGIVSIILIIIILYISLVKFKTYKKGDLFYSNGFSFQIGESYITDSDNKNSKITDNILVVTKVNVKGYNKDNKFNPAQLSLVINNIPYNYTTKYEKKLLDIGTTYKNQILSTKEYKTYLVVFEIPKKYKNRKKRIRFYNSNNQHKDIKIKTKEFKEKKHDEALNEETLEIDNNILKSNLTIDSIDIDEKMIVDYYFNVTDSLSYQSYEYLIPSYNDNYEKTLLKINGDFDIEENTNSNIKSLFNLLYYFGSIEYTINGKTKTMNNINREVKPTHVKSNDIYLEVNKEIENAEDITLVFNIKNDIYRYKIK